MSELATAQRAVRVKRLQLDLVRSLETSIADELSTLEDNAKRLQEGVEPEQLWRFLRLDELRVGDVIQWVEHHDGALTVTHWGRAAEARISLGTDRWSVDELLPAWDRVLVRLPRPPLVESER